MKSLYSSYTQKDWILVCVRFIIGAMFIFSGIVKLFPIEPFELKFVELGVANWTIAPFIARFVIAGELFLGLMLLLNIKPRITAVASLAVLVFFTFYLIYDFIKNGNEGNCGCFGTVIVMTPLESIVKNLLMIPLVTALLLMNKRAFDFKIPILVISLVMLAIALPFVIAPLEDMESHENANSEKVDYKFPLELIPNFTINGRKIDLSKGEYIIPLMNVNCSHCKKAAYKLHILNKQNNLPPIYLVLLGKEEEVPVFVQETKADFPYYLHPDENTFFEIAGNAIPRIFYIRDGIVKAKFNEVSLTESSLLEAMKRP
jgi:uncharacterized membrane protein YphA (DoxX/SURF4 family)